MPGSKSTTWAQNVLDLLFLNQDATLIGDAAGLQNSATAGSFFCSLHTADPTAGNQTTSEVTYTSYARVAVARTGSGWSRTGTTVSNVGAVSWPAPTAAAGQNVTFVGIGTDVSGTGKLLYACAVVSPFVTSVGTPPTIAVGDLDVTEV